jgi:hypothetical protein
MSLSDLLTWPYVLATRRANVGLSTLDSEEEEQALSHLRAVFGEDVSGIPCRVQERLLNWAPWTSRWLIWLSTSVRRVEPMPNYDKLRERLVDPIKFDEGCSVLHVAERLVAAGLRVSFDVHVDVDGAQKMPDLLVEDPESGITFHCEASVMYSAKSQVDQSRIVEQIYGLLAFHDQEPLAYAGRLLRTVADAETEGLLGRIYWEMMEVRKEAVFREVVLDDALVLALAPTDRTDDVASWALRRGLDVGTFVGALPDLDGALGLQLKVDEKARQLPAGLPNLLVVPAQDLFLFTNEPFDLLEFSSEIVARHEKIAILVLTSENAKSITPGTKQTGDHMLANSNRDGLDHQNLIIRNPSCAPPLSRVAQDKVRRAFSL